MQLGEKQKTLRWDTLAFKSQLSGSVAVCLSLCLGGVSPSNVLLTWEPQWLPSFGTGFKETGAR